MADNVVGIKFGVLGGKSITGESGALIKEQLESIASKIKLKVNIDKPYFQKQLASLKSEINKALGKLQVDIKPITSGGGTSSETNNSSSGSKEADVQAEKYKQLVELISQVESQAKKTFGIINQGTKVFETENQKYQEMFSNLQQQLQEFTDNPLSTTEQKEQLETLRLKLDETTRSVQNLTAAKQQDKMASGMQTSYKGLLANVEALNERYSDLIKHNKDAARVIEDLRLKAAEPFKGSDWTDADGVLHTANYEEATLQIQNLAQATKTASAELSNMSAESDTLGKKLLDTMGNKVIQTIAYALIGLAVRALKQVYDNVVKIDEAMTNLKIVTNANSKEMTKFADTVSKSAKKIGTSISDLIDSTTVFARLGYSLKDASVLAEKTTVYSNVADVAVSEATTNITAIIKAFNVSADELESVLDQLVYVGNNFAISSGEIGEGMNNAASSLAANGNTLQQAIAILTAANVTVQNANKSSTAVRTIAARMAGSVAELEDIGAETDNVLSSAKLDEKMKTFGVSILDATGNLRSTYDVLSDIAKIWDDINSTDRSAIAEMLSGTRQQNVFYSMMQNWSDAEAVVEQASNGYGALQKANEKYLDSIQGKAAQLKASWESFSTSLLNSGIVKFFVDLVKVIADVLNAFISLGDGAPVKIAIIIASVVALTKVVAKLQAVLGADLPSAMKVLKAAIAKGATSIKTALLSMVKSPYFYIVILISAFALFADKMPGLAQVIVGATLAISGAVALMFMVIKGQVYAFMASNPLGWILAIITAVVLAITTLVKGIISISNSSTQAMEKAVDAAKESKDAWKDAVDALNEADEKLEETKNRIAELQELSNNGTITLVQQQELDKLQKSLSGLEAQKQALQDIADMKKETAEKNAATAVGTILDEKLSDAYVQEDNTFWNGVGRVAASIFSLGISDAFGYGISDWSVKTKSAGDYVKEILGDWENATEQQRNYAVDFYNRLSEQKDMLSYHTGDNLAQWEKDANEAYNTYWEYVHRFILAKDSDVSAVWDSILGMERFPDIQKKLKDLANSGEVTSSKLREMYETDETFKDMVDYLQKLGIFSWDDASKVSGLVNQVKALADAAKKLEAVSFLDILEKIQGKFDALSDVLSDIEENGIAAADSISELLKNYPSLMKYFELKKYTDANGREYYQGYGLKDSSMSTNDVLKAFTTEYLQSYVDALAKCEEGTENYETAQNNLNNAIAVCATLLRSQAIEEETNRLNEQKDALEDQLDKYKDLIDIRKDLLETYADEVNYQKTLAQNQKAVVDLQTQLALARMDKSASGQAKVRQLESELEDAQDALDDFTLEKAIDVLTADLDSQYDEYKQFIDDEISRIEEAIDNIKLTVNPGVEVPSPTVEDKEDSSNSSSSTNQGTTTAPEEKHSPWKSYQDAADAGFSNIRTRSEFGRAGNSDKEKYGTYQAYLDAMYRKYVGEYHTGGFVGGEATLKSNEAFAKLLRGEFVSTPQQIDVFMRKTLPSIANQTKGTIIEYNSPLIEIKCDNVTEDSLPKLNDIVNKAVEKIKKDMTGALSRTGYRKQY